MKKIMLSMFMMFAFGGAGSQVLAAPVVSSVSGDSQTVSITGTGFGTKTTPGPMLFGDFENGTSGQNVTSSGPFVRQGGLSSYSNWRTSGPNAITINTTSPLASSSKHARVSFPSSSAWYSFISIPYGFSTAGQQIYVSFDYRYNISGEMPRQTKALIYYNSSSSDRLYMSSAFGRCENGGWRQHVTQGGSDALMNTSGPAINNEWVRLENHIIQSGINVSNGTWNSAIIRGSSIDKRSRTGVFRTDSTTWTQLALGGAYYSMCDGSDPATIDVDNIYIDNTPQRVEIGNASTWSATTHREILLPTAWSDKSITATVRRGRFSAGQTAYLYVVDSAGMVNSSGYPITIGSSTGSPQPAPAPAPAPVQPPAPPQGVKILDVR